MSEEENKHCCGCGHHHDDDCSCECECDHHHDDDACACGCGHHHDNACTCGKKPHIATPAFKPQDPNKGVSLGPEVEQEVADVMQKRYKRFLHGDEHFVVKTEVCHHFGLVSSVLSNSERTTEVYVEVSVECEENKIDNPIDAYNKALDVLDLVWLDYFDSERISHYLPIWQSYEIDSMNVNVRLEHSNPSLDDAASEFLKSHGLLENGLSPEDYEDEE